MQIRISELCEVHHPHLSFVMVDSDAALQLHNNHTINITDKILIEKMNKLNVFVSSTCFNLSQIRVDLSDYISNCGYNPILSEFPSFPMNPSKNTIDNCIDAVKNNVDIFILVIGNRYGSIIETGRSITNTEFLTAKKRGIPIYVFIDRKIVNILPLWEKNKNEVDYSSYVDTPKIFEFISEIRVDSKIWTFEFDTVQDIINVLKNQLSYLFKDTLLLRSKFNKEVDELFNLNISAKAINLILEKPECYEILFLFQTMIDEITKNESLKNDYEYAIILNSNSAIYDNKHLADWMMHRLDMLNNLIYSLNNLINKAFPIFYAEPGNHSDLKGIFYISETYSRIFASIINWTIETASTSVNEEYLKLRDKLAKLSNSVINDIWNFPFETFKKIDDTINNGNKRDFEEEINLTLNIKVDTEAFKEFDSELRSLRQKIIEKME